MSSQTCWLTCRNLDGVRQRAPRLAQQFVDPAPIGFSDSALLSLIITNGHRLGAQPPVLHQAIDRHAINLSLQFRQSPVQISGRVLGSLPMDDPPLEFE